MKDFVFSFCTSLISGAGEYLTDVKAELQDFLDLTGDGAALDDMDGRGAYGGSWPEGYDYDRRGSLHALELLLAFRSCGLGDHITGSRFWQDKIYSRLTLLVAGPW